MNFLITADIHLSDRARDSYRFGLFPWLVEQQKKFNPQATFLLGDITENKDRHSASLVNRLVDELIGLKPPVYILKGNHDYTSPDNPYFRFLNCVDGVEFISDVDHITGLGVSMIPHCLTQQELDQACGTIPPETTTVFGHQCLDGAIAETGSRLTGLRWPDIGIPTWCGDIHRPQKVGSVTYVGAPYQVRFGDNFTPRVLLLNNGKEQNLYFPSPRKWSLTIRDHEELLKHKDLRKGDQIKVVLELAREEVVNWATEKQSVLDACKELGFEVYGVDLKVLTNTRRQRLRIDENTQAKTNEDVLGAFCQAENVASEIKKRGMELLK